MKILLLILVVVLIIVILFVLNGRRRGRPSAAQSLTMEHKLDILADCGLSLSDAFKPEDLLKSWGREEYEKPGFDIVLVGLGMTEEQEPWRNHCVNLWHFDTECIEDDGDYKQIVERMVEMAQGSLPIVNIQDHVDVEKEEAWFSFTFQGKEARVDCKVEDDWVDSTSFMTFVELLEKSDPAKVFVYYDLGGQDCIIGCISKDQLKKLNSQRIKFVPLT